MDIVYLKNGKGAEVCVKKKYKLICSGPDVGNEYFVGINFYDWDDEFLGEVTKDFVTINGYEEIINQIKVLQNYEEVRNYCRVNCM